VEKRGLAYSVGAMIEAFHDTGTFEIEGASAPENLAEVFAEIFRTLGTVRAGKVTREELRRVKTRFAMHLDFLQDSPGDLCGWFGGGELYRPMETFEQKKAEMERVSLSELHRLARKWLTAERLVTVAVGPRSAKKKSERVITRAEKLLR
jgi:predicted Zn-dependent peptidase